MLMMVATMLSSSSSNTTNIATSCYAASALVSNFVGRRPTVRPWIELRDRMYRHCMRSILISDTSTSSSCSLTITNTTIMIATTVNYFLMPLSLDCGSTRAITITVTITITIAQTIRRLDRLSHRLMVVVVNGPLCFR